MVATAGQTITAGLEPLGEEFFSGHAITVAQDLVGTLMWRRSEEGDCGGWVVETEAYLGLEDPASHSYRGPTRRNKVMFGPPGHLYVYFIYGMHYCTNVTCGPPGLAAAVLIRALEPAWGTGLMRRRRGPGVAARDLCRGPGRLTQALGINHELNGLSLGEGEVSFWAGRGKPSEVTACPRIGLSQAADVPLRFVWPGHPCLSRPPGERKQPI